MHAAAPDSALSGAHFGREKCTCPRRNAGAHHLRTVQRVRLGGRASHLAGERRNEHAYLQGSPDAGVRSMYIMNIRTYRTYIIFLRLLIWGPRPFDQYPTGLGFSYFYGFLAGETSQYEPRLFENTNPIEPPKWKAPRVTVPTGALFKLAQGSQKEKHGKALF